eukprot:gnl/TRDRNA2_/TRDRNA2_135669_c2_seq1.p1 gnl/TRDRNA2_/TRDRNA2_135669_c2~~gnl/TRDRNA2_/TRDRNA2_135669_c2_seq1.p1  ORF type:complete len:567 (+),score=140.64 gnl/TRDRNA2_/TRDRNA2_135669_c2_seq1:48-1703(+)
MAGKQPNIEKDRTLCFKHAFTKENPGKIDDYFKFAKEQLGEGSYGQVMQGTCKSTHVARAIKAIDISKISDSMRFEDEVCIQQELDHPNIVKLYEVFKDAKRIYLVMELCTGGELFDRIVEEAEKHEGSAFDERGASTYMCQILGAMRYLHMKNYAHRDIKPENIVFCNDDLDSNLVKVIDWGLGFYFGDARMTSSVGSLTYAAPEVLTAQKSVSYSNACDLWSLGVVAYVMICGKPPFWGNHTEQLKRMTREQYPMAGVPWDSVSGECKDFIKRLLKKDPGSRMSIAQVLDHPWLKFKRAHTLEQTAVSQVLTNMKQFSNTSHFFSACVTSVARQLDHRSLGTIHQVFSELDTNGDGVLELHEVKDGFRRIFGDDSKEYKEVDEMFQHLDLDGSGTIDYTEFCAAGIGMRNIMEESTLWAAFKAFDVDDDDGKISTGEIKQVLMNADVNKVWSKEVCEEVAEEILEKFDANGDGQIDFDEWLVLMRSHQAKHKVESLPACELSESKRELIESLEGASPGHAYDVLNQVNQPGSAVGRFNVWRASGASTAA